ncbi:NUDIX hydrolase [Niabella ginsengisoli]|uniref:Uncharacterized protein n=1 Tax=Niabella ginsengisoli TaxID=522298 RepID=A0ABS9SGT9_9BACT|nr:hypothetical protein [Niabella ginsengisoli]MCH5597578.1 hypothetical protein [Niabella ginsengisoli]
MARKLKYGIASPEETEQDLRSKKITFNEAIDMIRDGVITDAISIMAIQKVQLMMLLNEY